MKYEINFKFLNIILFDNLDVIEQYRIECEARHWIKWVKINGRSAWINKKLDLERRRGKELTDMLVAEMNRQKNENAK